MMTESETRHEVEVSGDRAVEAADPSEPVGDAPAEVESPQSVPSPTVPLQPVPNPALNRASTTQVFMMGTLAGAAVVALVGFGVLLGLNLASPSDDAVPTSINLTHDQEVLLVDPVTRAPARSALKRWGRIAPENEHSEAPRQPLSEGVTNAGVEADKLAGSGDATAAAALLEQARANATSDKERAALGFQQVLMLNTAGNRDGARRVANEIGRTAENFDTQQAALSTIEGLEQPKKDAP